MKNALRACVAAVALLGCSDPIAHCNNLAKETLRYGLPCDQVLKDGVPVQADEKTKAYCEALKVEAHALIMSMCMTRETGQKIACKVNGKIYPDDKNPYLCEDSKYL
ncbi:MAG: hypothetical protein WC806_01045 [Candidatus Gracilibacteria bacterium]|jgi:hypothetical protein